MKKSPGKIAVLRGVGELTNCPMSITVAECLRCHGTVSLINSLIRCNCHKRTKMRNMKLLMNGEKMDSLSEAKRYSKLLFLLARGIISRLKVHPKYNLDVNGTRVCTYSLDFEYLYDGIEYSEDVKGHATLHFRIKWKLFGALFPEKNLVLVKP